MDMVQNKPNYIFMCQNINKVHHLEVFDDLINIVILKLLLQPTKTPHFSAIMSGSVYMDSSILFMVES